MEHEVRTSGPGYETTDAPVGTIVRATAAITVGAIVVCIGLAWLLRAFIATEDLGQRNPLAPVQQVPPEPRVEVQPWELLHQLRSREDTTLRSYGWVDKGQGIVRIPIDRAIDLTLDRGLPVRKGAEKK